MTTPAPGMSLEAPSACVLAVSLTLAVTLVECEVGPPVQYGIRAIGADSWISMYPS